MMMNDVTEDEAQNECANDAVLPDVKIADDEEKKFIDLKLAENENVEDNASKSKIPERESWSRKMDFIFSCIGYSVGLGNVWRFPYLCYKNGGGAFLIPYVISLVFAGIPMFFLELSLGQYLNVGGLGVWKICPAFKGVGYGTLIVAGWLNIYYIVVLAWALYYLVYSFNTTLPWSSCNNSWNTRSCFYDRFFNTTAVPQDSRLQSSKSVREFWERQVLQISNGLDEPGYMRWPLALTLLIAWVVCYFCIWKGVRWTGKITWFTSMFPYVLLFILLIRGLSLPGAWNGIVYYLNPDISRLADSGVWIDAVTQIFFSYGLVLGAQIALGSYNKYHNNVLKDTLIISCINSCTSILAGFVIFSVIGFMAQDEDVSEVALSGPGLAFLAYPSAVALMPGSAFWSILFFLMLFFVGLDSQFCTIEGFITAIVDEWPQHLRKRKEIFVLIVCLVSYLIGLSMVTQGGIYVFELFNFYSASGTVLLVLIFFECIAISWAYGVDRYYQALTNMLGYSPGFWWKICWMYTTPLVCTGTFLYHVIKYQPITYMNYVYPWWGDLIGWIMTLTSLLPIPIYALYCYLKTEGTFRERIKKICRPDNVDEPLNRQSIELVAAQHF